MIDDIRLPREQALLKEIEPRSDVQKAISLLQSHASGRGYGDRRNLLGGALRLTRSMSPEIVDRARACRERLGIERSVEVYIRPEAEFQATCIRNATGPLIVVLSSRMVEAFTEDELAFVIGHELGHALLEHFRLPMPALARAEQMGVPLVSRPTALKLYAWTRAAELSADRAGLVCSPDPAAAATGFFKLASGTDSPKIRPDLAAYAGQVEALAAAPASRPSGEREGSDWFCSHPYSPIRVRALYAYSKSAKFARARGADGSAGWTDDQLEAFIEKDLELMEPGYLEEKTEASRLLRRVLYAGGVVVAGANGRIEAVELDALSALLGEDEVERLGPNLDLARKDLAGRIEDLKKSGIPAPQRAQLLQHLTLVAAADGAADEAERLELARIAQNLEVDPVVIDHTLRAAASPMD